MPLVAAAFGLLIGSFLNVVIHRIPRDESVAFPASHCPHCGRTLRWWENVPVVSWLLLRGRCATCRAPISLRYPLVEAATAAVFALSAVEYGASVSTVFACLLGASLVAVLFVDLDHLVIPDPFVVASAVFAFGFAASSGHALGALVGAAIAGGAFLLIYAATRGRGMGLGDVKLAAALGLALPSPASSLALVIASFAVGACVAIPVLLAGSRGRRDALPFGPFLIIAAYVLLFAPRAAFAPFEAYRDWIASHGPSP